MSRAFGGKQVPTSTGTVKERKLGESKQTTEAGQRSKKLDIGYCTENEKQELLISNMKRKALEVYIFSSLPHVTEVSRIIMLFNAKTSRKFFLHKFQVDIMDIYLKIIYRNQMQIQRG